MFPKSLRRALAALAICLFLSSAPPAMAQPVGPTEPTTAQNVYLPLITAPGWTVQMDILRLNSPACTGAQQAEVVASNVVSKTASANVCIPAGRYVAFATEGNKHVIISDGAVLETTAGTVEGPAIHTQLNDVLMGNYIPGSSAFPTTIDGRVFELNPPFPPTVSAAGIGEAPLDWGLWVLGLNRALAKAANLAKIQLPKQTPITNYYNSGVKFPESCGMVGEGGVKVWPALWGHTTNPIRIKISQYTDVVLDAQGTTERVVLAGENRCMIPQPEIISPANFQYVGLDSVRNLPSFETYAQAAEAEGRALEEYFPHLKPLPEFPPIPSGKKLAIVVQVIAEGAAIVAIGVITIATGAFTTMKVIIIGAGACVQEFREQGLCQMAVEETATRHWLNVQKEVKK